MKPFFLVTTNSLFAVVHCVTSLCRSVVKPHVWHYTPVAATDVPHLRGVSTAASTQLMGHKTPRVVEWRRGFPDPVVESEKPHTDEFLSVCMF